MVTVTNYFVHELQNSQYNWRMLFLLQLVVQLQLPITCLKAVTTKRWGLPAVHMTSPMMMTLIQKLVHVNRVIRLVSDVLKGKQKLCMVNMWLTVRSEIVNYNLSFLRPLRMVSAFLGWSLTESLLGAPEEESRPICPTLNNRCSFLCSNYSLLAAYKYPLFYYLYCLFCKRLNGCHIQL